MRKGLCAGFAFVAMLLAGVALSQPGTGALLDAEGGSCALPIKAEQTCYYEFTADVNSVRIPIAARDFNVHLYATGGCEVYIMRCSSSACTSGEDNPIYPDTDGDGVRDAVTLDGSNMRTGMQNVQASWIFVDVDTAPSSGTCRVTVEGH